MDIKETERENLDCIMPAQIKNNENNKEFLQGETLAAS
jgi:hypothetical protein